MTNPLAQDLGGVVRLLEKATFGVLRADAHKDWFQPTVMLHSGENTIARYHHGYPDFTGTVGKSEYEWRNAEAIEACVNFLRAHSAEIAGALRDAERYRWLAANAIRIAFFPPDDEHEVVWETELGDIGHDPTLDTAIDSAMQQGGGG